VQGFFGVEIRRGKRNAGTVLQSEGARGMVSDNPKDVVESATGGTKAGNVDEELKKIYSDMRRRVSDVPAYIQLLKKGGLLERRKSAEFLGEIGDERGVLPLIDALNDTSITVQYIAAKSLGMLGDRRSVDPLIKALKSDEKWVRLGAVHALGLIGDKKAVDFIIPLLNDPHHDLRAHAAWALGKLGDSRATGPLKGLLQDPEKDVRSEANLALRTLGGA
jgi:HEAT repeat protein